MLSTEDKKAPILSYLDNKSLQYFPLEYWSNSNLTKQHLYIISDEEINKGDWCVMLDSAGNVFSNPQQYIDVKTQYINDGHRKIIASTDKSLNILQIPEDFIKIFIKEYNKDNIITYVMIEYDEIEEAPRMAFSHYTEEELNYFVENPIDWETKYVLKVKDDNISIKIFNVTMDIGKGDE